jgi:hypothetical protein
LVIRYTNSSAINCPRDRGSPTARAAAACFTNAAYTATPHATGTNADTYVIVSGAGRQLTRRSFSAFAARATNTPGSNR